MKKKCFSEYRILPLLPGPLFPGVVTPDMVLSMGQIVLFDHLKLYPNKSN